MVLSKKKNIRVSCSDQPIFCKEALSAAETSCEVPTRKIYPTLVQRNTQKGFELEMIMEDYPITPDYVKSFLEGSDYHYDVSGAIANSIPRVNLGDITAMQDVVGMDTYQAASVVKTASEAVSVLKQKKESVAAKAAFDSAVSEAVSKASSSNKE